MPKVEIVKKIIQSNKTNKTLNNKYIMIGDDYYDYQCAIKNKINLYLPRIGQK